MAVHGTWLDHCMSASAHQETCKPMVSDTTDTNEWNGTDFWTTDRSRIFASHVLQPQTAVLQLFALSFHLNIALRQFLVLESGWNYSGFTRRV